MKYLYSIFALALLATPVSAATVTANVTLQRGVVIQAEDLTIKTSANENRDEILGAYLGKQLKRTVYAGFKLNPAFVGNPILVKRNSRVNMIYRFGHLEINAWGRALDEGGAGDVISIMNLESRKRIQGIILPSGIIEVRI